MLRKLVLSMALFTVFSPAIAQVQVFVTNGTSTGNLGGLAGADATCTAAALAATPALTGTWTAWLSDSGTNAVDRILDGEYQLLDGTVVANDKADLTDGSLDAPINRDENNALYANENSWTGTLAVGGTVSANTCSDWTDATSVSQGTQGDTDVTTAGWTELGSTAPCDFVRSLYCFADVVPTAPVVLNNVSITSTNLSFDVVGTITKQGSTYQQQLMFGLVDDASDWLTSFDASSSTWVSNPGNEHVISRVYSLSGVWTDSILTVGNNMSIGDSIDLSFNFVGQFNVGNFDLNNFGMSNGLNTSCCIVPSDLNLVSSAPTDATYTVGGTVSGLTGSVTLQNNGGDDIIKTTNDGFTFTAQAEGTDYAVTVSSQPSGQTCTVTNDSGTNITANITDVTVTCVTDVIPTYSVGGSVSGLTGSGLALQNNGGDTSAVAAAATAFTFTTKLLDLATYAVTVSTQPTGQTCSVTGGDNSLGGGAIAGADVTNVAVDCVDDVVIPPTPATPVPTLSQWALIMLSMFLGLMVFANRRRLF